MPTRADHEAGHGRDHEDLRVEALAVVGVLHPAWPGLLAYCAIGESAGGARRVAATLVNLLDGGAWRAQRWIAGQTIHEEAVPAIRAALVATFRLQKLWKGWQ